MKKKPRKLSIRGLDALLLPNGTLRVKYRCKRIRKTRLGVASAKKLVKWLNQAEHTK